MTPSVAPFLRKPKSAKPPKTYKRYRWALHRDQPLSTEVFAPYCHTKKAAIDEAVSALMACGVLVIDEVHVVAKRTTTWEEVSE